MQKFLILYLFIFISAVAKAQTALVKDPEGYCNVRQAAGNQSKIIDTLTNNKIVFVYPEQAEGNWWPVDYTKGDKTRSGYVHKSRVTLLSNFTKFKQKTINDSTLKLHLDSFQLSVKTGKFNKKSRQIKYENHEGEQAFVKAIDNKHPWGTDGNVPIKEYKLIQFTTGSNVISFPRSLYNDLFEPNLDMTMAYVDRSTGKVYIEAINSDGAGGYVVIWIIDYNKIIGRETFIPF
ncbi:SH3 domain-containing protein [Aridibaculum aurantiacum]|uniref:SH3 domain-containing protein n=1 Tax=Aridibaculum aurantiacum TaxID=2810307 RepID=UPI001A970676|nr:SH3 domain-containing protein [Aridibaculum aurantiacum]